MMDLFYDSTSFSNLRKWIKAEIRAGQGIVLYLELLEEILKANLDATLNSIAASSLDEIITLSPCFFQPNFFQKMYSLKVYSVLLNKDIFK
jgi:hypothetical protein